MDLDQTFEELGLSDGDTVQVQGEPIFDCLYFQRPDGKRFEVAGEDLLRRTIQSLKEREVAPRTKVDPSKMKVCMGCIEMEDNKSLWDYNIEYGEYLTLRYVM